MHEIERVLRKAGRRLLLIDLFHTLTLTATIAGAILIVALLAERVLGATVPWKETFVLAGALAVIGAVVWSLVRRARGVALARELDERAGLRESLSTALCVSSLDDPWSRVVVETARQRAMRVVVRDAVPITMPRLLPMPAGVFLALALLWFVMPQFDLSGNRAQLAEAQEREVGVIEAKRDVQQMEDDLKKLLEKANIDLETDDDVPESPEATGDEVRMSAIRKLTKLEDTLKEARESETAKQAEAMRQMMRRLRTPGPGPLQEMSKAMAQGNFDQAKKALEEMARQMATGEMTDEQREQAEAQLKNLADQLEKLADQQEQLKKQLQDAGMSAEQAQKAMSNPQAMQQAMQNMENLSESQKQQLMEQMQAQMQAGQQCQSLSECLGSMAMASGQGKMGEMQEGVGAAAGMLSDMEMMQAELSAIEASLAGVSQCMSNLAGQCQGEGMGRFGPTKPWAEGDSSKLGDGSGGPGRGNGLGPDEEAAEYAIQKEKASVKRKPGPTTGERWVYGEQVRGESREAFANAVHAATANADEAIEQMQVEREYEDAVKKFFGTLERRAEEETKDGK